MSVQAESSARRTLFITSLVGFMVAMEITIISIARSQISEAFPSAEAATLSWVITAYNIGVASLLLPAGWMADRYGRKKVFLWGLVAFIFGSLLSGLATSPALLIGARVVQSIGGAAQYPAGLALLLSAFPLERRMRAIGVWGAVSGLAAALAPSLGALLIEGFGWRSVFLINVPVALLALIAGRSWLIESRSSEVSDRVDLVSVPMASLGIGVLLLALVQGGSWGWTAPATMCSVVVGVLMLATFFRRSLSHTEPLFDLRLFGIRTYAVANIGSVFFLVAFFSWIIVLPEFIQETWGWSVLQSGFAIAPGPIVSTVLSVTNGRLADRIGPQRILVVGGIAGVGGLLLHFGYTGSTPSFFMGLLLPNLVMGVAAGCSFAMLVGASMSEIPSQRFGMAGAGRTTVFQLSIAIGAGLAITLVGDPDGGSTALEAMRRVWMVGVLCFFVQAMLFCFVYPRDSKRTAAIS
ncbi:MAG: DHA2 family efflux MFS transporter permease subunit [Acidimicrobiales bacterium]|jgi:EmrB/QacA subfamily drug resistance transporter|nr:DHA2 family efflux MFS transporter permease subunit [Acidimicrobiales bacterium]